MMTLRQLSARFQTQEQCLAYLVAMRWPDVVYCPRCGNDHVYALKSKPFKWQCKKCAPNGYRFSPLTGTIFENTKYPLKEWFQVILLVCQAKKGLSALQVQRHIGMGQYRTAWYMCHRIRAAMKDEAFQKLTGVVEVDETYVGGKAKNRQGGGIGGGMKRGQGGRGTVGKVSVVGAIARKGNVVCRVIEATDAKTLDGFVDSTVADRVSMVATDEHQGYRRIGSKRPHGTVDHSAGEYVRGEIHTANIDSFWSLIKRGIFGNFHHVSKKYLPLYLNEFSFRHNNRENPDMFSTVVAGS
jgi:transposase-like protein